MSIVKCGDCEARIDGSENIFCPWCRERRDATRARLKGAPTLQEVGDRAAALVSTVECDAFLPPETVLEIGRLVRDLARATEARLRE